MSMIINPYAFAVTGSGDPFWANVGALLHFEGADGSTTFTDSTGRVWTPLSTTQIDTAEFKFGAASGLFNGGTDGLGTTPGAALNFGTGDLTLECFVRHPNSVAGTPDIFSQRSPGHDGLTWRINSSRQLQFFYGAGSGLITSTNALSAVGAWNHVALTRSGLTMRLFIDGNLEATGTLPSPIVFDPTTPTYIGRRADSTGSNFNGHIDEFRATKGVARYTANFTPPAAPFPDGP